MPDTAPPTVLIVEPSETTRKILEFSFVAEGFVPVSVASMQEALFSLRTFVPNIAVVEVQLPDATGLAVVRTLRDNPVFRSIPVLMIAGSAEERAALDKAAGFYEAIFDKPFSLKKMVLMAKGLMAAAAGP